MERRGGERAVEGLGGTRGEKEGREGGEDQMAGE